MWVLICLLSLLILVVCVMLFAPFYFEINSTTGLLQVRFWVLAGARIVVEKNTLLCKLEVLWWRWKINMLQGRQKKAVRKSKSAKKKTIDAGRMFRRIIAVLKSFKVNKCAVAIDTGDVQADALLYPGFYWLSRYSARPVAISFNGDEVIILEVQNTIARMLWAFIRN